MRIGLLSVLLALVACTPAAPAAPTAAPTAPPAALEHVRYATTTGSATSAPVYIAQARGYFQQQGVDVELVRGVRDFLDAFDGSNGKDQDQIISILTSATLLKDPAQWKNVPQTFDPNGAVLLDTLKFNQQWYVEHGAIQTPVDLDAVWDPTYTDYAIGVLGKR